MVKTPLKLAAALVVLAALMGAEKSCEQPDRNKPKATSTVPVKHTVEIRAHGTGPYTVLLIITDPDTGGLQARVGPEQIARGEYKKQITYESGKYVGIQIVAWGHLNDTFQCSITDGPKIAKADPRNGEVQCVLITSR